MTPRLAWRLVAVFSPLSLMSIGGGQSVLGDMQKQVVVNQHWLTQSQFLTDFAIARASAGPASIIVSLIGWQVGGLPGALIASVAIFAPSALLFYAFTLVWRRPVFAGWQKTLGRGLAPVAVGLSLGGSYSVLASNGASPLSWLVALGSMAVLLFTKVHPLMLLAAGGLVFVAAGAMGG
jgi:chromate transporter